MTRTLGTVATFEFGRQLRSPVLWVVFGITVLMVGGSVRVEELRVGLGRTGLRNGADAVLQTHLVWTLFYLFTTAALVSDAVLRDETTGFAPVMGSLPVQRLDLVLGRFAGAVGAVLLCFLGVPLAMLATAKLPGMDPATLGPVRPSAYALALLGLALPNLLLGSAVAFGLATAARSLTAALLGAVALLIAYGLGSGHAVIPALLEPFGFAALADVLQGWTGAQRDATAPPLAGVLLANRLLWLGVSAALVALACLPWRSLSSQGPTLRRTDPAEAPMAHGLAAVEPTGGCRLALAQMSARVRLEAGQVFASPVFAILLLLGAANAGARLWAASAPPASPTLPVLLPALVEAFGLVPAVVALFFSGELLALERDRRMEGLIGASPLPDAAFLLPKLLAIMGVLASLALASGGVAALVQAARHGSVEPLGLLLGWVVPMSWQWSLVAVVAVFLQAVSPGKLAGWGFTVLFFVATLALDRLGVRDPLLRYARYPGWPDPGWGPGAAPYVAFWSCGALGITVLATGLVGRSPADGILVRLRALPGRLRGPLGMVGLLGLIGFLACGGTILLGRGATGG